MQKFRLFLLSLSHFIVDTYATLLPPILPLVREQLSLSLTQAGFLGTIVSSSSLSQPLMGLWADRMARRYLIVAGLGLTALCSPLMGVAPSYATLVLALALGGFGVATFHPQSFSLAGELSGQRRSFGLALFIFGGTMGLGLTPFWVPYYASRLGLNYLPLVSLIGLFFVLLLFKFMPLDNPQFVAGRPAALWKNLGSQAGPLLLIIVVVILRSITGLGFGTFLAELGRERGLSLIAGGIPLGVYNIAGVVGGLTAGYLADRVDPRILVWGSLILAAPALYAFVYAQGWISYLLLMIGGGLLLSSNSILVAMAQELAPENSGLVSSLPLGFSWGIASLFLPLIGYSADQFGMATTLKYLALLPLLTALLAFFLPAGMNRKPIAPSRQKS